MAAQTLDERINSLSSLVDELSQDQEKYEPLVTLVDSVPNLLKLDQILSSFKKKSRDLKEQLKANKALIKATKDNLNTYEDRAKRELEMATIKRDKENRILGTRLGNVENSFKQLSIDNQVVLKTLEIQIKEEVCGVVQHVEDELTEQQKDFKAKLATNQEEIKKYKARLLETSKKAAEELKQYEEVHGARIQKMQKEGKGNDPNQAKGRENMKNWLVQEVTTRLENAVQQCHIKYEQRFKSLNLKYNEELLSLRAEVEQVRDSILNKGVKPAERPETQLEFNNENARRLINHVAAFSASSLDNLLEIAMTIAENIEEIGNSQSEAEEILAFKENIKGLKESLANLETRIDADLYNIQESLRKAGISAKEFAKPNEKVREEIAKTQRLMKEGDLNKANIKNKVGKVGEEISEIEKRMFTLARQKGLSIREEESPPAAVQPQNKQNKNEEEEDSVDMGSSDEESSVKISSSEDISSEEDLD
ncbi:unnamed protein product [Blepharisma stoltei]|uniref:Uncharacterized protein n=1 Tax=Blepharisma stoltei TaxID=1481888 RepID=A0AAU9IJ20_9CILI|nr:unnamed protein product [Blepharisma stoltei]